METGAGLACFCPGKMGFRSLGQGFSHWKCERTVKNGNGINILWVTWHIDYFLGWRNLINFLKSLVCFNCEDVYPDQARAGLVIQMRMPIYHQSPIEKEDSLSVSDSDTDPIWRRGRPLLKQHWACFVQARKNKNTSQVGKQIMTGMKWQELVDNLTCWAFSYSTERILSSLQHRSSQSLVHFWVSVGSY